jgi:hypothetical protein
MIINVVICCHKLNFVDGGLIVNLLISIEVNSYRLT